MDKVVISSISDVSYDKILSAVENTFDLLGIHLNHNKIVIKPNLCYYWDYSTGQTTDPRIVSAIIDVLRERAGGDINICIAESDASAMKTRHSFKMLGYSKLAAEKNVELVNLSEGEIVNKEVEIAGDLFSLPVNQILIDSDFIVNVPTLKTHREIGFTCALKNMFGVISKPRKYSYHNKLSQTIVAINKIVISNLVLVDGIIVSGRTPKKMGVLIGCENAFSADKIAAEIVGYNYNNIPYLRLASKENLSKNKIDLIDVGNDMERLKREFPKMNYNMDRLLWKIELWALKLYANIVGDIIPPVLEGV